MPRRDDPLQDYYAELVAIARKQGRDPSPEKVARAEGREVEPGEIEAWERRLGIDSYEIKGPQRSSWSPSPRSDIGPRWHLRSADETSTRSRSRPSSLPELHETGGSGFTVALSPSVSTAIQEEVLAAIWEFDSREIETGGYLYGLYPADEDRVSIVYASGPGHNGKHGSGRMRLSDPNDVESSFDDTLRRAGLVRVGDWHSHPWDDPIPSDADLRAWGSNSDDAGVLPYTAVIATPAPDLGWTCPRLNGWVTREDEQGVLICEPAKVSDG
jgi:proteasome lid subunit RPN8/RPN11